MGLPKTGPSEAWMPTTRLHGRTRAVSRLGQGHSAAPRSQAGGSLSLRARGALLRGGGAAAGGVDGLEALVFDAPAPIGIGTGETPAELSLVDAPLPRLAQALRRHRAARIGDHLAGTGFRPRHAVDTHDLQRRAMLLRL